MGAFLKTIFRPIVHPLARILAGLIAIPAFRLLRRRVIRVQEWDDELEKDIDEWFRGALLLLLATANVEWWIDTQLLPSLFPRFHLDINVWWVAAGRILLAIGVIEKMPDQALFSIIHTGPPKLRYDRALGLWGSIRTQAGPFARGLACLHLNRSSPLFVIMAAIFGGITYVPNELTPDPDDLIADMTSWRIGWICYFLAITQYLIIGLVTSRDRALDVLSEFDRKVAERRQELIDEFHIDETKTSAPVSPSKP
ncbi:MAG: DNA topoisomerase I [Planctomycetaceae bacterium]|nr:DNA topoisomerase I [Planctomycetaceae bacterium]